MLYGCGNHGNSRKNEQVRYDTITKTIPKHSAFVPAIEKGISEVVQYIESKRNRSKEKLAYSLTFFRIKKNEFMGVFAMPFYVKNEMVGYTYYNERMVVYYGDTIVGNKYVDMSRLELFRDTVPGLINYDSGIVGIYDPYGISYQIITPDSLLMVHKGMMP